MTTVNSENNLTISYQSQRLQERLNTEPAWALPTSPSRTSQIVALIRSEFDRPFSPKGDPDAQRRLCTGMKPTHATWLKPTIFARTRFFDEQVLKAISNGISQVVICGAGYDDRPLRFRAYGVRFFELDHPDTQADKARRLREIGADVSGLTLIPADFRKDDPAKLLRASDHRASTPTLFVCEGLLAYLDQQTTIRLLEGLRSISASGSILASSLAVHRERERAGQAVASANARRRTSLTEPWLTVLSPTAYLELFEAAGWNAEPSSLPPQIVGMLLMTAHPNRQELTSIT